jgi:ArsR family transcriptional regulator
MQIADVTASSSSNVTVLGPSLALELSWATHAAWSPQLRTQHPVLAALAEDHPELVRGVTGFWGDGMHCFTEFQVLADIGGALTETEVDRLFDTLAESRRVVPDVLTLASETPVERATVIRRLHELRDDDRKWSSYVDLLRALYAPLDHWWRNEGIPAVEQAVESARRELARGADWTRMVVVHCTVLQERFPEIIERRDPVALAVCALFGKGLYLDLPDCQLIGLGAGLGELGARARTANLARRIKVIADPTRLAILDHLRTGPRSVSDIAMDFALAQPTVSAHVKQLRQAGLVTATRTGTRLELSVNTEALATLTGELNAMSATPGATIVSGTTATRV